MLYSAALAALRFQVRIPRGGVGAAGTRSGGPTTKVDPATRMCSLINSSGIEASRSMELMAGPGVPPVPRGAERKVVEIRRSLTLRDRTLTPGR